MNPDTLADFLNRELTGNLLEVWVPSKHTNILDSFVNFQVPGIGKATVDILMSTKVVIGEGENRVEMSGITSTFGLIGVFLAFKNGVVNADGSVRAIGPAEHTQRFYLWWTSLNTPAGFRAGVIHSICEKTNISFPGIYDSSAYGDDI